MPLAPVHEETDHQAAEHAQYPKGIGAADPAAVLIEGDVQALMGPVLDSPGQAIGFQPVCCVQVLGWHVGDEADRLVFASAMLPGQQSGLSGERKPNIFGGNGAAFQRAAFGNALILFEGPGPGWRGSQRGKNPWAD